MQHFCRFDITFYNLKNPYKRKVFLSSYFTYVNKEDNLLSIVYKTVYIHVLFQDTTYTDYIFYFIDGFG